MHETEIYCTFQTKREKHLNLQYICFHLVQHQDLETAAAKKHSAIISFIIGVGAFSTLSKGHFEKVCCSKNM